ncbi:MFS transporter, partial [Rhizobium ruizarguesonis]
AAPIACGPAIDVAGNNGFAWAIAALFGLYALLSGIRLMFIRKRA